MEQRISLITLGCRDIAAQTAFYRAMGWRQVDTLDGVVAFDLLSQVLGLYPLAALAADIGVAEDQLLHAGPDAPGPAKYAAATLGYNAGNPAEVDQVMAAAAETGAAVLKPAAEVFWGGYHGYFADPEGTVWEVAHNPFSPLGPDGAFCWNGFHANAT